MTRPTPTELLLGLGGAAMLAVGLAATRGVLAGALAGGLAAFGLAVRWRPAPLWVLLLTAYLSLFPDGYPIRESAEMGRTTLHLLDLVTVAAGLVYTAGHYRQLRRADDADDPTADELAGLFAGVAAAVLGGTAVYYLVTRLQPDYARGPLRLVVVDEGLETGPVLFARTVMLAGLLGTAALLAGLGLWLARLNRLTPAEARQLLLDTRWLEARRELARLETWRAWATRPPARRRRIGGCLLVFVLGAFGGSFVAFLWILSRLR